MLEPDLTKFIEQDHRALDAFVKGNPEPLKDLYSRRDDVIIANPFGPPARGWEKVAATMERAATNYREGEATGFERISDYATADLGYIIEIERFRSKVGGGDEIVPLELRVTTIFRREEGAWRIILRHADPITSARSPESITGAELP
ncbi:ketosteroid isomerase-like protein [Sinorhizobium kostiense]|uniref:Ketosteroid isomerase-like protein n=1 Tax=Sinorhizobium kostiense TaxID=76747 RepID=A0ABS4R1G6_9HYPH|nr:nuclear transport factor 2 family protein [Sinorhizobium kostiense]MBP2236742.1 ketosteroid isomerase-like protein [Sinorhizobium kostiense]